MRSALRSSKPLGSAPATLYLTTVGVFACTDRVALHLSVQLSDSAAAARQGAEDILYKDVVAALGPKRLAKAEERFVRSDVAHYTDAHTYAPLWGDSSASAALWDGPTWAATHAAQLSGSITPNGGRGAPLSKELVHILPPKTAQQFARRKAEDSKADAKLARTGESVADGATGDSDSEEESDDGHAAEEIEQRDPNLPADQRKSCAVKL